MTVAAQTTFNQYTGNGLTTVFPYQFKILDQGDLDVYVAGALKTLGVDYTVSGVGADIGGSVIFVVAPAALASVSIIRAMTVQRLTDYQQQGDFNAGTVNPDFDRAILLIQDQQTQLGRSIRTPADEVGTLPTLPSIAVRAGKFMGFGVDGLPVALTGTGNDSALRTDLASTTASSDGARLVGYRRVEAGSSARSVFQVLNERLSITDFGGNGNGIANNDGAFTNANAASVSTGLPIYLPPGDYLVTAIPAFTAGVRLMGEGRIVTTTTHRRTWEYGGEASTVSDRTYYVDVALGNDKNTGLSAGAGAFKTLQRAWNQLPPLVLHRITINYAVGNYEETETSSSEPRAAILYLTGKYVRGRTDQGAGGTSTTGYVLFVPASAAAKIRTTANYHYGVYCSQVSNVGFSGLNVDSNGASTVALLVSHRPGTYVQVANPILNGNAGQSSLGAYAESGAVLEMTGTGTISGSQCGVEVFDNATVVAADNIAISGTLNGFAIDGMGTLLLAAKVSVTTASTNFGGNLKIQGTDTSNRVSISGGLSGANGQVNALFCNFSGALAFNNTQVFMNVCGYSNTLRMNGGSLDLRSTPSFISPAVASTVAIPLSLGNGCSFIHDSGSTVAGSTGRTNATYNGPLGQSIAANGTTINILLGGGQHVVMRLDGSGGNRTNNVLAVVDSTYGGEIPENTLLSLFNDTANEVQIINSTTADFVGGAIVLASASTRWKGCQLVYYNQKWREVGRSLTVP